MAKIAFSSLWLLALWMTGGFFAFLLLPFINELPAFWGIALGWLLFLAQLFWGSGLAVRMLRWSDAVAGAQRVIDSDIPFVLLLNGVSCTRGAAGGAVTEEMLEEWRAVGMSESEASYLSNMLALPSLLRAFEAVTNSYGRLRLSEGPLWYLGRFLGGVALLLEWPLRSCWGQRRPDCRLKRYLEGELVRQRQLPAWMWAFDLLSPLSLAALRRQRRGLWLDGKAESGDGAIKLEADRADESSRRLNLGGCVGLLLGILLALPPCSFWGALPLGAGFDLIRWFNRRWPRHKSGMPACDAVLPAEADPKRGAAVCWRGSLIHPPEEMAFDRVPYCLQSGGAVVAVSRLPRSAQAWCDDAMPLEISGWLENGRLELQADRVIGEKLRWHARFRWKYGLLPWALAFSGAAWWMLQCVGI
ncbi:hypothetical protein IJT17_10365 [bacterium]|nr:hypothetical protein [bacterium]